MPLFDMLCKNCDGFILDALVRMNADSSTYPPCPKCGGAMSKEIAIPARAQFKGAGFHRNDYQAATKG